MHPLEITDQYGDRLLITTKPDDFVYISMFDDKIDGNIVIGFEVNKDQAIQIINHLKQCFEI